MRVPNLPGSPRGYPISVHFKLSLFCKGYFAYLYLRQTSVFFACKVHFTNN